MWTGPANRQEPHKDKSSLLPSRQRAQQNLSVIKIQAPSLCLDSDKQKNQDEILPAYKTKPAL